MNRIDIIKVQMEALGWMYAEACNMLDRGEDLREVGVSKLIDRFNEAFKESSNDPR